MEIFCVDRCNFTPRVHYSVKKDSFGIVRTSNPDANSSGPTWRATRLSNAKLDQTGLIDIRLSGVGILIGCVGRLGGGVRVRCWWRAGHDQGGVTVRFNVATCCDIPPIDQVLLICIEQVNDEKEEVSVSHRNPKWSIKKPKRTFQMNGSPQKGRSSSKGSHMSRLSKSARKSVFGILPDVIVITANPRRLDE
jgi:hypothetical protein